MAGNDYRAGRKQVNVVLSLALHGQLRAQASASGLSMSDWVSEAIREKVNRDAGGSGSGDGRSAEADGCRSRHPSVRGGKGDPRVGAGDVADPVEPWDALAEINRIDDAFEAMFTEPTRAPALRLVGPHEELA